MVCRKENAEFQVMARVEGIIYFSQKHKGNVELCKLLTRSFIIKEHTLLCSC